MCFGDVFDWYGLDDFYFEVMMDLLKIEIDVRGVFEVFVGLLFVVM